MSYIKKKSAKQESRTAEEFGGKTQIASGALWGAKGDVRTGSERTSSFNENDFLIENKFTDKDKYKLDRKVWEKIDLEAVNDNFRTPLMQVDIQDLQLVIMDFNYYSETFKGYNVYEFMGGTNTKSRTFAKVEFENRIQRAREEGKIPVFVFTFSGKIGYYKPLKLVFMCKEDFLASPLEF